MATKKLYCKVFRPEGKRFAPIDLRTRQIDRTKEVFLYPDKPVEVESKLADILLEQDPHLVSTKPYDPKEDPVQQSMERREKHLKKVHVATQPETAEERAAANARFIRDGGQKTKLRPVQDKGLAHQGDAQDPDVIAADKEDVLQYVEILSEIMEVPEAEMTIDFIRTYGKKLNMTFKGKKRDLILKQFNERCDKLTAAIEKRLKTDTLVTTENHVPGEVSVTTPPGFEPPTGEEPPTEVEEPKDGGGSLPETEEPAKD